MTYGIIYTVKLSNQSETIQSLVEKSKDAKWTPT